MVRVGGEQKRERKWEETEGWEGREGGERKKQWLGSQLEMWGQADLGRTGECALRGGCSSFWTTGLSLVYGWWGLE